VQKLLPEHKNRVKRGYFSKFSTGEIPVSTGPVPALIPPLSAHTQITCLYTYAYLKTFSIEIERSF
jgi:hypothetical protein